MKLSAKFMVALATLGAVACTTNTLEEGVVENNTISRELPNEISVSFDEATSRIQLDEQCRTTWTEDDELSVFYFSDANNRFLFMGDTGDRNGALVVEDNRMDEATAQIDKVVLVYPYSDDYKLNASTKSIGITIPGTQYYLNSSYGVGANIMTSVGTTNDFALKSVCGWIKVQLTGAAASVTKVTLTGNNKEQLAGDATLYYEENRLALLGEDGGPDDNSQVGGTLFFGEYVRTITLDCGDGIALDSTSPTEFYFVLAPQTFDEGITINATLSDGTTITKSTSKSITIERNVITPMASFDVQPTNEIWYTSTDGNIVEPNLLSGYDNMVTFGANIISNTYENGKGIIKFDGDVTSIEVGAFWACTSLTSITIPNSVFSIGEQAFASCESLTSITIPDSVTSIGNNAFFFCELLTSVSIPNSVFSIGEQAFASCTSLTSITIPNSVTSIGNYAFLACSSLTNFYGKFASEDGRCLIVDGVLNSSAPAGLTEYTIPDSVTSIGTYAFGWCTSLTSATIPDSVTSIGTHAFSDCSSLTSVTIGNGVTSIGDAAFWHCESLTSVTIGNGVTSIGNYAFDNCTSLTSIPIPDSVTSIGRNAFVACSSLTNITIPDGVTSIGNEAFSGCTSLTSATIGNSVTLIGGSAFRDCTSLTSVTIPDSVTEIGEGAFCNCSSLAEFKGKFASSDGRCLIVDGLLHSFAPAGLNEYTIPNYVTSIGDNAFSFCSSLTSITIPDSVTAIGDSAFRDCDSLTSITIPDSITSIGVLAFYYCTSLTSVYCKPTTPPSAESSIFHNNASGRKIYVPTESVDAYKTAQYWSNYADAIEPYVFE